MPVSNHVFQLTFPNENIAAVDRLSANLQSASQFLCILLTASISLFRNRKFLLDKLPQRNTSTFTIFLEHRKSYHIIFCFVFHFMSHLDETYFLMPLFMEDTAIAISNLFKRNMMYLFRTISEKISSLIFTTKSTNFCTWSFGKIQVKFSRGQIIYK